MPSAIDLIGHNAALQEHWIRRLFAFVIDVGAVAGIGFLLAIPLSFPFLRWGWYPSGLYFGVIWFLYSMFLETIIGGTIGKKLLSLRVVAIDRNLDLMRAVVRNIPKIFGLMSFGVVILGDLVIGAITQGDPRQRLFDRAARTTVTRVDQGAYMEEQFRMMQHAGPHPMTMPPAPPPSKPPRAPKAEEANPGAWPGQAPAPSTWPKHEWDEEGRLMKEMRFCTACGGQLVARGDGKLTCVRCGAVY